MASSTTSDSLLPLTSFRLIAINGASLAIGITANMALLLGFANRLKFFISQPVSIVGWYISSILLFVIVGLTPSHLDGQYAYAQPFVYAILAACLYLALASLLGFTTLYAKKGHYSPDFSETLTLHQRTLMAQSTCFIFYLTAGAAVFSHIEGWPFVDGAYWATVTLLTIGYGDIAPVTHLGRSLTIPYALAGIIMLGLVAGSVGSLVLDRAAQKMNARWILRERELRAVHVEKPHPEDATELEKERREFMIMRQIQSRARSKQR